MSARFGDHAAAGRALAAALLRRTLLRPVVVAVAGGGGPVGVEIARALGAPLEVLPVCRIHAPGPAVRTVAAVAQGTEAVIVIDDDALDEAGASEVEIRAALPAGLLELARRRAMFGAGTPASLAGRSAVLVDDGMATGTTMRAAARALRTRNPGRILAAVPITSAQALSAVRGDVDGVTCLSVPRCFRGVADAFLDFRRFEDAEVLACTRGLAPAAPAPAPHAA